jgi:sigma-54 specific flagellar transcriptional regulator A
MTEQDLIFLGACALVDCGRISPLQALDLAETIYFASRPKPPSASAVVAPGPDAPSLDARLKDLERREIASALEQSRGVVSIAARKLGLKRTTLIERIRRHR